MIHNEEMTQALLSTLVRAHREELKALLERIKELHGTIFSFWCETNNQKGQQEHCCMDVTELVEKRAFSSLPLRLPFWNRLQVWVPDSFYEVKTVAELSEDGIDEQAFEKLAVPKEKTLESQS